MRILVVGANSKYAIELPYIKYLRQQKGIERVDFFEAQNIFLAYYQKGSWQKIVYRLGLSSIISQINDQLKLEISRSKPDFLFVFKGMEILPETLVWAKQLGIKTVNYNPDNPFLFTGVGSGNRNITQSIGIYDLHLSYDATIQQRIEQEFRIKCHLLPFGFELDQLLFENCQLDQDVNKVCFLGNPDHLRANFLNQLAKENIPLVVYGHNWSSWARNGKIQVQEAVYGDQFWRTLRKYRVQLNIMRVHNPNSHNMRTFEIPAVGGIQLAPDTPDHQRYFVKDEEIFLYQDVKSCAEQAKKLLLVSSERAEVIRSKARKRSLESGYRYEDRAAQLYQILKTL